MTATPYKIDKEYSSPRWAFMRFRDIGIDWVITGGESGPHARPADPAWYRQLRDQAAAAGVPFHFKQWGEWLPFGPTSPCIRRDDDGVLTEAHVDGKVYGPSSLLTFAHHVHVRVGKKAAGRQIDGRTWDQFPETAKEIHQ